MKNIFLFLFLMGIVLQVFGSEQNKIEGPWIKERRYEYRYVTYYDIQKIKKPLANYPWIEEDCHDQGNRFANWSQSISYEISYGGGLNFSLLGVIEVDLGTERNRTIEMNFQRWITPTEGIRARHRLYENYEVWKGQTYTEYKSGESIEFDERAYPFSLTKVNYGISVEREILEYCQ